MKKKDFNLDSVEGVQNAIKNFDLLQEEENNFIKKLEYFKEEINMLITLSKKIEDELGDEADKIKDPKDFRMAYNKFKIINTLLIDQFEGFDKKIKEMSNKGYQVKYNTEQNGNLIFSVNKVSSNFKNNNLKKQKLNFY